MECRMQNRIQFVLFVVVLFFIVVVIILRYNCLACDSLYYCWTGTGSFEEQIAAAGKTKTSILYTEQNKRKTIMLSSCKSFFFCFLVCTHCTPTQIVHKSIYTQTSINLILFVNGWLPCWFYTCTVYSRTACHDVCSSWFCVSIYVFRFR